MCDHFRRLTVDVQPPCPGASRRTTGKVPGHLLLGPAYRLAWAMSNLRCDGLAVDQQTLRWLGLFATSKNSAQKLRAAYNRMLRDCPPHKS